MSIPKQRSFDGFPKLFGKDGGKRKRYDMKTEACSELEVRDKGLAERSAVGNELIESIYANLPGGAPGLASGAGKFAAQWLRYNLVVLMSGLGLGLNKFTKFLDIGSGDGKFLLEFIDYVQPRVAHGIEIQSPNVVRSNLAWNIYKERKPDVAARTKVKFEDSGILQSDVDITQYNRVILDASLFACLPARVIACALVRLLVYELLVQRHLVAGFAFRSQLAHLLACARARLRACSLARV